jgi:hypothetical protein
LKEPQDIVDKDFIHFECHDDKLKKAVYEVGYKNLKKLKGEG